MAGELVRRRRPFAGTPIVLSELAFRVAPSDPTDSPGMIVELLRRARRAGVTTFDAVDVPDPPLAELLLARAFPTGDPDVVVIGPGPRAEATGRPAGWGRTPQLPPRPPVFDVASPAASPSFVRLVPQGAADPGVKLPAGADRAGLAPLALIPCSTPEEVAAAALRAGPKLLVGALSLLDQRLLRAAERASGTGDVGWVARDPFAGGRLDGRRFLPSGAPAHGAPPTLRQLDADFAPVARLSFLARTGQRTLAQAALRFLLERPWVATVCLPLPTPDRWQEIVGFRSSPGLDEEELRRAEGTAESPSERSPTVAAARAGDAR
ncbi:MAG TPA: aldo/keto reductase [Thermoplasmata archaeon]|nr:aldo/keto reductase [Thermoplasmata archaeon]